MTSDQTLEDTLAVLAQFKPKSVFLYGSRARKDFKPDSDYEIGVIFDEDKYVERSKIHAAVTNPNVKAYPFKWEELNNGTISFVFQKSLYLRELIHGGRTVAGQDLLPTIKPIPITMLDLIQRTRFDIGMALAALLSYRTGDMQTSMEEFSKACFFGLRTLVIMESEVFPIGYDEIYEKSAGLVAGTEYLPVIEAARSVRKENTTASIDMIFENISLLDSFIEPKLIAAFNEKGNVPII
jgi:predicted nucleotidyltransferase